MTTDIHNGDDSGFRASVQARVATLVDTVRTLTTWPVILVVIISGLASPAWTALTDLFLLSSYNSDFSGNPLLEIPSRTEVLLVGVGTIFVTVLRVFCLLFLVARTWSSGRPFHPSALSVLGKTLLIGLGTILIRIVPALPLIVLAVVSNIDPPLLHAIPSAGVLNSVDPLVQQWSMLWAGLMLVSIVRPLDGAARPRLIQLAWPGVVMVAAWNGLLWIVTESYSLIPYDWNARVTLLVWESRPYLCEIVRWFILLWFVRVQYLTPEERRAPQQELSAGEVKDTAGEIQTPA